VTMNRDWPVHFAEDEHCDCPYVVRCFVWVVHKNRTDRRFLRRARTRQANSYDCRQAMNISVRTQNVNKQREHQAERVNDRTMSVQQDDRYS
jgi:hypothetical protein